MKKPLLKKIMFIISAISTFAGLPFVAYCALDVGFRTEELSFIPFSDSQMFIITAVLVVIEVGALILHEKL